MSRSLSISILAVMLTTGCDSSAPASTEDFAKIGWERFKAGEDGEASEAYDRAVQVHKEDAFILAMRGLTRAAHAYYGFRSDRPSAEGESARASLTAYWDWGQPVFSKLSDEDRKRRREALNQALSDVEKAAQREPADARVSLCRGVVYLLRSDLEGPANLQKAIEVFSQTIVLDAGMPDPWVYRAQAHLKSVSDKQWTRVKPFITSVLKPTDADRNDPVVISAVEILRRSVSDQKSCPKGSFVLYSRIRAGGLHYAQYDPFMWHDDPFAARPVPPIADEKFFAIAKDSVVLIRTESGIGTGFFPTSDFKVLLTNHHVIEDARNGQVQVVYRNGKTVTGMVIHRDKQRDLAAVRVEDVPSASLFQLYRPAGPNAPFLLTGWWALDAPVGLEVFVIGHPQDVKWTVTKGIVSAVRTIKGVHYVQIDAPASHGSSGGPVLTKQGAILGVLKGGFDNAEGLNFAILFSEAHPFFQAAVRR